MGQDEELAFGTGHCEPKAPEADLRLEASPRVVFSQQHSAAKGDERVDDTWVPGWIWLSAMGIAMSPVQGNLGCQEDSVWSAAQGRNEDRKG